MSLDDASCTRQDTNTANKQPKFRIAERASSEFSLARFYSIPQKEEEKKKKRKKKKQKKKEEEEEEEENPPTNQKPLINIKK